MSRPFCLIVGASGVGKSTLVDRLEKEYGLTGVQSFTTRPKRSEDEKGHYFVTEERFDELEDICAYTEYEGYRYGATKVQIEDADLYIIDEDGIEYFTTHYDGEKDIVVVHLTADMDICARRMIDRGDDKAAVMSRIAKDKTRIDKLNAIKNNSRIKNFYEFKNEGYTPHELADAVYMDVLFEGDESCRY